MRIAIINGPNLNLLGTREPAIYGTLTYQQLQEELLTFVAAKSVELFFFQDNHEGNLVDLIQQCPGNYDAIVINAAAYTHTSIAILDALLAVNLPSVEVHLSNPEIRDSFRQISYLRQACVACFQGEGILSYKKAIIFLQQEYSHDNNTK